MLKTLARSLRHRWLDESDARRVVDPALEERLRSFVAASERRHTGEIRICVEGGLPTSYLWRHWRHSIPIATIVRQRAAMQVVMAMITRGELQFAASTWNFDESEEKTGTAREMLLPRIHAMLQSAQVRLDAAEGIDIADALLQHDPRSPHCRRRLRSRSSGRCCRSARLMR